MISTSTIHCMNKFCTMGWQCYSDILQGVYIPAGKNLSSKRDFRINSQEDCFASFSHETPICFLFLEIKFLNGAHSKKGVVFDLLFTYFSYQGKLQNFLHHISHLHTYMYFAHPIDFFCLTNFEKKKNEFIRYGFSSVWFLVLILIRAILEQSINNKMVSKI